MLPATSTNNVLTSPVSENDHAGVVAYRNNMYKSLWKEADESGVLSVFDLPVTPQRAAELLGIEVDGSGVFESLLQVLCKSGALMTSFNEAGERVFVRTSQRPSIVIDPHEAIAISEATGLMTSAQASIIPNLAIRALNDSNARLKFSKEYEPFWRAALEAKFYASGRDMACYEIALPGSRVVDLASGMGHGLSTLSDKVGPSGRVIGVEISPDHVQISRDRVSALKNVDIINADLNDGLGMFQSGSIDGVTIIGAFHFVLRKEYLLSEIARVTKPGAKLVIGNCFSDVDVFDREYLHLLFNLTTPKGRALAPEYLLSLLRSYGFSLYFDYFVGAFGWFYLEKREKQEGDKNKQWEIVK